MPIPAVLEDGRDRRWRRRTLSTREIRGAVLPARPGLVSRPDRNTKFEMRRLQRTMQKGELSLADTRRITTAGLSLHPSLGSDRRRGPPCEVRDTPQITLPLQRRGFSRTKRHHLCFCSHISLFSWAPFASFEPVKSLADFIFSETKFLRTRYGPAQTTDGPLPHVEVASAAGRLVPGCSPPILGNWQTHTVACVRDAIEAASARILYFPASCPAFNPIDPSMGSEPDDFRKAQTSAANRGHTYGARTLDRRLRSPCWLHPRRAPQLSHRGRSRKRTGRSRIAKLGDRLSGAVTAKFKARWSARRMNL